MPEFGSVTEAISEIQRLVHKLDRGHAVIVVRVDQNSDEIEKLEANQTYMTRLIISTLVTVVIGVALAALAVVIAL